MTVLLSVFTLSSCQDREEEPTTYDVPAEGFINLNELPYRDYLSNQNPVITITVEGIGQMQLQLFPDIAPNTVNNIIAYINRGDYSDNEFHRIWDGFMIQGGMLDEPYCTIVGEMNNNPNFEGDNDLSHYRGVISMARVGGLYDSQSSQFFIVHEDSAFLDNEYAAFGGLVSGFNVLDFIAPMGTEQNTTPEERVVITSITVDLNGYTYESPVCE